MGNMVSMRGFASALGLSFCVGSYAWAYDPHQYDKHCVLINDAKVIADYLSGNWMRDRKGEVVVLPKGTAVTVSGGYWIFSYFLWSPDLPLPEYYREHQKGGFVETKDLECGKE
jgi:hypothetical protein